MPENTWKELTLAGWGRTEPGPCHAARPERMAEVAPIVTHEASLLARGAGRSYGDAAVNEGGGVVLTGRLDRILNFDEATGDIVVEPGISFRDLLRIFLPRGFIPPVMPGTGFATIGGAVAQDVHGKNHDRDGSFGDHIKRLYLMLADGRIVQVTPEGQAELFQATVGGIGLTGMVLAVAFRMKRVPSNAVRLTERRMPDLDSFMTALAEARESAAYSVGWIDAVASGTALGRGILQTAEPAEGNVSVTARTKRVPVDFPSFALSGTSVKLFNRLYYGRIPANGRVHPVALERFLFPLDAIEDWNRIYGKRGFRQFQCVIPDAEAGTGIPALMAAISRYRGASFLAVLKTLGREGVGYLSFPMRGFTLALDFPVRSGLDELMTDLHRITLDRGGRIYLAKDSCLDPASFAAMYPRLPQFRAVLDRVDPAGRWSSSMARRLDARL